MNLNKLVIVMNGAGGVGKDTLCQITEKYANTLNVSSVDPIKELARSGGWKGKKDLKARKLLSDLKLLFTDYNNLPLSYMFKRYVEFLFDNKLQIMFVHIREPEEIKKFVEVIPTAVVTVLVRRKTDVGTYGNMADDNVENYDYDFYFDNNSTLEEAEVNFMNLIEDICKSLNVSLKGDANESS